MNNQELHIRLPEERPLDTPAAVWDITKIRLLSGRLPSRAPKSAASFPVKEAVRLACIPDDGQRLVIREPQSIALLAQWLQQPLQKQRTTTRRRWYIAALSVWLFCLSLYLASPAIFSFVAWMLPQSWEEQLGKGARDNIVDVLRYLPDTEGPLPEASKDSGLHTLMERLRTAAPVEGYSFDVLILKADFVNAFAFPGGHLLVSTGLIESCESPDELAGVLAHEMAHVTERHGTARMLRQYVWTFFSRMLTGSDGAASQIFITFVASSFDRDDERAADSLGAARLITAGISPVGLSDFFQRLQQKESKKKKESNSMLDSWKLDSYLGSHPDMDERRANITRILEERPQHPLFSPAMSRKDWQALRAACKIADKEQASAQPAD